MLRIADRYILLQVTKPLVVALTIGIAVLLSERLVLVLDLTLGKKNAFSLVLQLLAYWLPHYAGIAAAVALYLGLLFGFSKMSKESEVDAFMAAGVGLHQLTRPVALLACGLAVFALLVFGWLQPHAGYAYRSVVFALKSVNTFYLAEEGVFMQSAGHTFVLDRLARHDGAFERIFLFNDRGPKGFETVTAASGMLIEVPGEARPVLRLDNGLRLDIGARPDMDSKAPPPPPQVANFARVDAPLGALGKLGFRQRGENEREMTLPELYQRLDDPPKGANVAKMRGELHMRFMLAGFVLLLPFMALPFAIGRRRSQRVSQFAVALVLLVASYELLTNGAVASKTRGISPYLTIWLPFACLTAFVAWHYWVTCFRLPRERFTEMIEGAATWIGQLCQRLLARHGGKPVRDLSR